MYSRQFIYTCLFLFFHIAVSKAQLIINNSLTPTQLVQNHLVGTGVTISNVTINPGSDPRQFGHFINNNSNLPISNGIVMMTGYTNDLDSIATNIDGAFTSQHASPPTPCPGGGICGPGDLDLDTIISPTTTFDAAVLEFDFVAISDTVRFRYTFASEEYNEYVCSQFNDVFAFFISGPGFPSPTNIANIPGTSMPVSINTVNNGTIGSNGSAANCTAAQLANSAFFIDNTSGPFVQFDGMTTTLEAWAVVQPCATYHIKLAIADAFDGSFDSGIFLEAGSFSSRGVSLQTVTANSDSIITEQCNTGQINFVLEDPALRDTTLFFTVTGTATNGVDYQTIADSLNILTGDSLVTINIIPITDGITEGLESIILTIPLNNCSSDTLILYIGEETPPPAPDSLHCYTIQDSIIAFGWFPITQATSYQVSIDSGTTWVSPNSSLLSHQFYGVPPNTSVGLWVRSIDSNLICTLPLVDSLVCMDCGMNINIDTIIATCEGTANGAANLTMTLGTAPFSYSWSNGNTSLNLSNVVAGTYTLSVTDANGCTTVLPSVEIDSIESPIAVANTTDQSCDSLGSISLSVSGGSGPYSFIWNTNATTQNLTSLNQGTYTVSITGGTGCTNTLAILIDSSGAPIITLDSIHDQSCSANGSIDISLTGSATPYLYHWNTGATTEDISGLFAGTYTITVTGANNCTTTMSFNVGGNSNIPVITISQIKDHDCFSMGSIQTSVSGGTSPYQYLWSNTATTANINGLSSGFYNLTVTDGNNCQALLNNVSIDSISSPSVYQDTVIHQGCTTLGSININTSGGVLPFVYSWSNGASTQNITGLTANTYTLTLTDANNCTATLTSVLTTKPPINVNIDSIVYVLACDLQPTGTLVAQASGGTPPLTYNWSNAITTAANNNLDAGIYSVTVTDGDCNANATIEILAPLVPNLNAFIGQVGVIDTSIYLNQSILVDANNSTSGSFNYAWTETNGNSNAGINSPNMVSSIVQPLDTGMYQYRVIATSSSYGVNCSDSSVVNLQILQEAFLGLPNIFSPNSDNNNDYFYPIRLNPTFIEKFEVYNRWGQVVYQNNNSTNGKGWDGTYKGVPQAQDVYLYLLKYKLPGQNVAIIKGEITLIR